jgi:hypothetical protein
LMTPTSKICAAPRLMGSKLIQQQPARSGLQL